MKKEKRTLLIGLGAFVFVVAGALAYWFLSWSLGRILMTAWVIFMIVVMLYAVWLLAENVDSRNQGGGGSPPDIGGRGMWG